MTTQNAHRDISVLFNKIPSVKKQCKLDGGYFSLQKIFSRRTTSLLQKNLSPHQSTPRTRNWILIVLLFAATSATNAKLDSNNIRDKQEQLIGRLLHDPFANNSMQDRHLLSLASNLCCNGIALPSKNLKGIIKLRRLDGCNPNAETIFNWTHNNQPIYMNILTQQFPTLINRKEQSANTVSLVQINQPKIPCLFIQEDW